MKLWWPHNEAMIACLMAYEETKDDAWWKRFEMVSCLPAWRPTRCHASLAPTHFSCLAPRWPTTPWNISPTTAPTEKCPHRCGCRLLQQATGSRHLTRGRPPPPPPRFPPLCSLNVKRCPPARTHGGQGCSGKHAVHALRCLVWLPDAPRRRQPALHRRPLQRLERGRSGGKEACQATRYSSLRGLPPTAGFFHVPRCLHRCGAILQKLAEA